MRYKRAIENFHFKKEKNLLKLNSKNFYRNLNKKLCTHSSLPNLFKDNRYITSDKDKANEFLNSFNKLSFYVLVMMVR